MSAISIKQLLEAGVHFGHQTHRWNPKMREYIFGERNGIYIIDLQKTLRAFKRAVDSVVEMAAQGKTILFVGTKAQAQEAVEEAANSCGMYFVNNRWLGGMLTNFATIQIGIKRYKDLETRKANGHLEKVSKKEASRLERERKKLERNLRGIRDMDRLPDAVFIVDSYKESIAVKEANRLGIPVIGIVDTNCDPDLIEYPIPGNDDALRSVRLFAMTIAEAAQAGRQIHLAKLEAKRREAAERAAKEAASRKAAKEAKEAARKARAEAEAARQEAEAASEEAQEGTPDKAQTTKAAAEESQPTQSKPTQSKPTQSKDAKAAEPKPAKAEAPKKKPAATKRKSEAKAPAKKPAAKAKATKAAKKKDKEASDEAVAAESVKEDSSES